MLMKLKILDDSTYIHVANFVTEKLNVNSPLKSYLLIQKVLDETIQRIGTITSNFYGIIGKQ